MEVVAVATFKYLRNGTAVGAPLLRHTNVLFLDELKLTVKAASFNYTSGTYSAEVVLCRKLYLTQQRF
ncbi:hypothetical protein M2387_002032 [Klebsiella sp. BIGb0407]|nr:hypothetical protein [Klebsiella sp. BIGb0407]